jgi:hypothetical protein
LDRVAQVALVTADPADPVIVARADPVSVKTDVVAPVVLTRIVALLVDLATIDVDLQAEAVARMDVAQMVIEAVPTVTGVGRPLRVMVALVVMVHTRWAMAETVLRAFPWCCLPVQSAFWS